MQIGPEGASSESVCWPGLDGLRALGVLAVVACHLKSS